MEGIEQTLGPCPPNRFAGRGRERQQITKFILGATDQGRVVLIPGRGALGKSSLMSRLEYDLAPPENAVRTHVVIRKGFQETHGTAYKTFLEVVGELREQTVFGRFEAILQDERVQRAISILFDLLDAAVSSVAPKVIATPLGVATGMVEDRLAAGSRTPDGRYDLVLDTFSEVLNRIGTMLSDEPGADHRLVLILDDVHLATGPDRALLRDLVKAIPGYPCIVLVIADERRAGDEHEGFEELVSRLGDEGGLKVDLQPFESDDIQEFARLRYAIDLHDEEVAAYLRDRLGEPVVLVSCFNQLVARRLAPDIAGFAAVIDAGGLETAGRACFLGNDDQRDRANLLCILGTPFHLEIAGALEERGPLQLWRLKNELESSPVFRHVEGERYDFVAPWIKEYCRDELPRLQAVAQHALAARGFESRLGDLRNEPEAIRRRAERARAELELERHYFEAREYDRALDLALRIFDRSIWSSDFEAADRLVTHAIRCAEALKRRDALADAYLKKGDLLRLTHRGREAYEQYRTSLDIYLDLPDGWAGTAQSQTMMGAILAGEKRYGEALELYRVSLALYRAHHDQEREGYLLDEIGHVYERLRDLDTAFDVHQKSLAVKRQVGNLYGEACSLLNIGAVRRYRGEASGLKEEFEAAQQCFLESWRACDRAEARIGDGDAGGAIVEQLADLRAKINLESGIAYRYTDPRRALLRLADSLERFRALGNRGYEGRALREMGTAHCMIDDDDFTAARACFDQSLVALKGAGDTEGTKMTEDERAR